MRSLALLHASQLITLAGPKRPRVGDELAELRIIRDGGILVRDGRVDAVGPSDEIEKNLNAKSIQVSNGPDNVEIIDLGGRVALPGFVDAHTHLVFGGNRLDDF